jgi:beta-1,4-mannosyltransferase
MPRGVMLNPVPGLIHDGLEFDHGWTVRPFGYWRAFLGRYSILHFSFPNVVFRNRSRIVTSIRAALAYFLVGLAKRRGRRLVWTVHNIADHERYHGAFEKRYMDWYTRQLDLVVHLSEAGRRVALEQYPELARKPSAMIPHPHYGESVAAAMPREQALDELGLPPNTTLVLAFGVVRRYKNLLALVRAFSSLPGENLRLVIAGMPLDLELAEALYRTAIDPRVLLMLRPISDRTIGVLFSAASLVVAPYVDILNSGTALLSLTYGKRILVPNRGAMPELQGDVGADWLRLFEAPLTPVVLGGAIAWAKGRREEAPDLSRYAPRDIVAAYDSEFAKLLAGEIDDIVEE